MSEELPVRAETGVSYEKKNIIHTARLETDTAELCKPKLIRKRHRLFGEKVVIFHYRGNDDYYTIEIN